MKIFNTIIMILIIGSIAFVGFYIYKNYESIINIDEVNKEDYKEKIQYVLILGAMEEEIDQLKKEMVDIKTEQVLDKTIYIGKLYDKDVILSYTGIGMISASSLTASIFSKYDISYAIFSGVAGALSEELAVADIVVATDTYQYMFDATAFGYNIGQIPRMETSNFISDENLVNKVKDNVNTTNEAFRIHYGRIVSADKFVSSKEEKLKISKDFNALAVDMESAAFGQVAYLAKIPSIVIRSISDSVTDESVVEYNEFLKIAIVNNIKIIKGILK